MRRRRDGERPRSTVETLGRWPLLIAAVVCIGAGMSFDVAANDTEETRAYLLALGAVLLGAWVALLAAHDYRGADPPDREPTSRTIDE